MNPEYGPLGLNETLRIDGVSYIYDPHCRAWMSEFDDPLYAVEIHELIAEGSHRVLPWTDAR